MRGHQQEFIPLVALEGSGPPTGGGPPPEQLTALGHHLAALPVDVRIGKLIILGTLLQCTEQALTLAAALSMRSPFVAPYGRRNEADESKANWAVGMSDHMAILKVYEAYDAVIGGDRKRVAFCQENMLSFKGMQTLYQTRRELLEHLWEIGFVRKGSSGKQADKEQQEFEEEQKSAFEITRDMTRQYCRERDDRVAHSLHSDFARITRDSPSR